MVRWTGPRFVVTASTAVSISTDATFNITLPVCPRVAGDQATLVRVQSGGTIALPNGGADTSSLRFTATCPDQRECETMTSHPMLSSDGSQLSVVLLLDIVGCPPLPVAGGGDGSGGRSSSSDNSNSTTRLFLYIIPPAAVALCVALALALLLTYLFVYQRPRMASLWQRIRGGSAGSANSGVITTYPTASSPRTNYDVGARSAIIRPRSRVGVPSAAAEFSEVGSTPNPVWSEL